MLELVKGVSSLHFDPTRVTQISWRPRFLSFSLSGFLCDFFSDRMTLMAIGSCRAFIYRGFLTHEECDHLMTLVSFYIAFCVPRGINFGFGYFTVKRYLKK